jgi:acetolactate synthase-1/2/3 large subunit
LTFKNPDFVAYAKAYGANAVRVEKPRELRQYIDAAFKAGGVHIIDVPINYEDNKKVLIEELNNKSI